MLTPPEGLSEDELGATLGEEWGLRVGSLDYRPLGWGSHHWEAVDSASVRWFVTVDDLETKRHSLADPLDTAYGRLRAALRTARTLREHGHRYVVAPVPTRDGEPLARLSDRFAVSLHRYVEGQSFGWGEYPTAAHRQGVLDLVTALHAAPAETRATALVDDFAIPHRDELASSLRGDGDPGGPGPYARPAADLLVEYAAPVRRLLARYDELVTAARADPSRLVLTHGEPHPGNTMRVGDDWLLIDWETVLLAPPERDLWILGAGSVLDADSVLDAYAEATGTSLLAPMLELYRIRWHLTDIAVEVNHFRRPHPGDAGDDESWKVLRSVIEHIAALPIETATAPSVPETVTYRRRAARVLLVDAAGRILLLRCLLDPEDPGQGHCWMVPGGGVVEGESLAQGAARELHEEVGLLVAPEELGRPVAQTSGFADLGWAAGIFRDDFFHLRVDTHVVDTSGMEPFERGNHDGHRWWSVDELVSTDELVQPYALAPLLADLLAGRVPDQPVELPWHHEQ